MNATTNRDQLEETMDNNRPIVEAQPVASWTTTENRITVLFTAPLVTKGPQQNLHLLPKLDHDKEQETFWQILKKALKDIELHFDNATGYRLLAAISSRGCIHFSGHRQDEHLIMEDELGGMRWFHLEDLQELIYCELSVPCCFVFLSASCSCRAGETFAAAGVLHVICCQDVDLKDCAAHAFTKHFYKSVVRGKTVKEAFEDGCKSVCVDYSNMEMDKFLLLPENGNHDVPLFEARPVSQWPSYEQQVVGDLEI